MCHQQNPNGSKLSFSTLLCAGQPRVPLLLWAKVQLLMVWLQRQNNCPLPATRTVNLSYYAIYYISFLVCGDF